VGLVGSAKALHSAASHLKGRMQPNYHALQAQKHDGLAKTASVKGDIKGADKHHAQAAKHLEKQMDAIGWGPGAKKSKFDAMVKWARQGEWTHPHGGGAA
jgi:hypothetical protein